MAGTNRTGTNRHWWIRSGLFGNAQQVEIFADQIHEKLRDGDELGDFANDVLRGGGASKMLVKGKPGGFSFLIGHLGQSANLMMGLELAGQAKHGEIVFYMLVEANIAGNGIARLFRLKFAADLYEFHRLFAG